MTEKKSPKQRIQIKDLPKPKEELTKEEQKKVKGGECGDFYAPSVQRPTIRQT